MLLHRTGDWKRMIGLGQVLLMAGMLCTMTAGLSRLHTPWTESLALSDFTLGFLVGFGSVLIGVSIVLNVRGMVLRRNEPE